MALKGTTKIELTNVKTGEREVVQKDNLVTNAVADLISIDPGGYRLSFAGEMTANDLTPICPNSIGGILCYENPLDENPDKYYAEPDNPLIACSSNDVNSGTSALRGSMNQTESGPLEDESGYRFVFDFSTSQGNGNISAVALTHKYGGISGWGDELSAGGYAKTLCAIQEYSIKTDVLPSRVASAVNVISYNEATQELESLYVDEAHALVIEKYRFPVDSIGLLANARLAFPTRQTERTVLSLPDDFIFTTSGDIAYIAFVDGGDGNWYGFSWTTGYTTTSASVVRISKENYTMETYNYTISAPLRLSGILSMWKESGNTYYMNGLLKNITIANGFLYAIGSNLKSVYKIMLESGIVLEKYDYTLGTEDYSNSNYPPNINIVTLGNRVITRGLIIEGENARQVGESLVARSYMLTQNEKKRGAMVQIGPYLVEFGMYRYNTPYLLLAAIRILAPYLATINNLPTPVQKTADKTMKITYILREES